MVLPAARARSARMAAALGGAADLITAVRDLRAAVGLPDGLGAAGFDRAQVEALAPLAFADVCHSENPRACTEEDLRRMYAASL